MTASEWNDSGIELMRRENPHLATRKLDIMAFDDHEAWDFIFCRELYPFTRVNAFTDQHAIVSRLIDGLRPGGVLVLAGEGRLARGDRVLLVAGIGFGAGGHNMALVHEILSERT